MFAYKIYKSVIPQKCKLQLSVYSNAVFLAYNAASENIYSYIATPECMHITTMNTGYYDKGVLSFITLYQNVAGLCS